MAVTIGPKIGIDGESEYRKQLQNIIEQAKTLDTEMKAVTASFDKNSTAEQRSAATHEVLTKQIETQKERVALLTKGLEEAKAKYGETATETLKWQQAVNNANSDLSTMEKDLDGVADNLDEAGDKGLKFGDIVKANVVADFIVDGIKALGAAIADTAKKMRDSFVDTAQWADNLATLSVQTGISTQKLQEYEYMADLIDTDVETITGSMAKLTKNMSSASSGTGAAADAFASLGINVTAANGELRSNDDVFAEVIDALGRMTNETERDATAMAIFGKSAQELNPLIAAGADTVASLAQEAHDLGYVLDEETVAGLTATKDAMARLDNMGTTIERTMSGAVAPILNQIADQVMPHFMEMTRAFADLMSGSLSTDQFFAQVQPIVDGLVQMLDQALPVVLEFGGKLLMSIGEGILSSLPQLAITATQLIAGLVDGLGAALPALIPAAVDAVITLAKGLIDNIPALITAALSLVKGLAEGILTAIPELIKAVPELIKSFISGMLEHLPEIIKLSLDIIVALAVGLVDAIPELVAAIPEIASAVIHAFTEVDWAETGGDIIDGICKGVADAASRLWQAAKEAAQGALNGVKKLLGIHSPSKVFRDEIGKMIPAGISVGIDKGTPSMLSTLKDSMTELTDFGGVSGRGGAAAGGAITVNQNFYKERSMSAYEIEREAANGLRRVGWGLA